MFQWWILLEFQFIIKYEVLTHAKSSNFITSYSWKFDPTARHHRRYKFRTHIATQKIVFSVKWQFRCNRFTVPFIAYLLDDRYAFILVEVGTYAWMKRNPVETYTEHIHCSLSVRSWNISAFRFFKAFRLRVLLPATCRAISISMVFSSSQDIQSNNE